MSIFRHGCSSSHDDDDVDDVLARVAAELPDDVDVNEWGFGDVREQCRSPIGEVIAAGPATRRFFEEPEVVAWAHGAEVTLPSCHLQQACLPAGACRAALQQARSEALRPHK